MDRKKRFWLFIYDFYYPVGGMDDLVGTFDSFAEAVLSDEWKNANMENSYQHSHIYDTEMNALVRGN